MSERNVCPWCRAGVNPATKKYFCGYPCAGISENCLDRYYARRHSPRRLAKARRIRRLRELFASYRELYAYWLNRSYEYFNLAKQYEKESCPHLHQLRKELVEATAEARHANEEIEQLKRKATP